MSYHFRLFTEISLQIHNCYYPWPENIVARLIQKPNPLLHQFNEIDAENASKKVRASPTYDEVLHEFGEFGLYEIY